MEHAFRQQIMPAFDALIEQLCHALSDKQKEQITFYLEMLLWQLVCSFACELLKATLILLFNRGDEGSRRNGSVAKNILATMCSSIQFDSATTSGVENFCNTTL